MVKLFIILANTATLGFLTVILSVITGEARSPQVLTWKTLRINEVGYLHARSLFHGPINTYINESNSANLVT